MKKIILLLTTIFTISVGCQKEDAVVEFNNKDNQYLEINHNSTKLNNEDIITDIIEDFRNTTSGKSVFSYEENVRSERDYRDVPTELRILTGNENNDYFDNSENDYYDINQLNLGSAMFLLQTRVKNGSSGFYFYKKVEDDRFGQIRPDAQLSEEYIGIVVGFADNRYKIVQLLSGNSNGYNHYTFYNGEEFNDAVDGIAESFRGLYLRDYVVPEISEIVDYNDIDLTNINSLSRWETNPNALPNQNPVALKYKESLYLTNEPLVNSNTIRYDFTNQQNGDTLTFYYTTDGVYLRSNYFIFGVGTYFINQNIFDSFSTEEISELIDINGDRIVSDSRDYDSILGDIFEKTHSSIVTWTIENSSIPTVIYNYNDVDFDREVRVINENNYNYFDLYRYQENNCLTLVSTDRTGAGRGYLDRENRILTELHLIHNGVLERKYRYSEGTTFSRFGNVINPTGFVYTEKVFRLNDSINLNCE